MRARPIIPHAIPTQPNPVSTQNPQNSNDQTSDHETRPRELHAKLLGRQGPAGLREDAPSEARGGDSSRAGRHTPAQTATRHHWCGGRRRVRRARAGFEIDHSEPQARVWRSRGRPGPTAPGTPVGPQATQAGRPPPTGTHSNRAPPAWRAPEGPEGTGGLRGAAPNEVRPPSLAGGRGLRRPERQRRHTEHSTGARARRPAPLDATTQTRQLRSTDVPCRSARAARRSRRSSRNPRLRRRAGPRR